RATPQVQIWDSTKEGGHWRLGADKGSGGLWNNSPGAPGKDPLILADRPPGQWNSLRIRMVGERVTVHLNGTLVVDHARLENYWNAKIPLPRQGPIQLQTHGGSNGLAIRYPGQGQPSAVAMCEIQILDDDATKYAKLDPRQFNGSAYGIVPAHRGYLRPVGEWNFMEVTVRGPTIVTELNGT